MELMLIHARSPHRLEASRSLPRFSALPSEVDLRAPPLHVIEDALADDTQHLELLRPRESRRVVEDAERPEYHPMAVP